MKNIIITRNYLAIHTPPPFPPPPPFRHPPCSPLILFTPTIVSTRAWPSSKSEPLLASMSSLYRPADSSRSDDDGFLRAVAAAEVSAADAAAVAGRKHWGKMWVAAEKAAEEGEESKVDVFFCRVCCCQGDVLVQRGMRLCRWRQTAQLRACRRRWLHHRICGQRKQSRYQREEEQLEEQQQ